MPIDDRLARLALTGLPAVVVLMAPDDRIMWVSPALTGVFGWEATDWVGHLGGEFIHPQDLVVEMSGHGPNRQRHNRVNRWRMRCADGQHRWVSVHSSPLYDGAEFLGRVVVVCDIEEQVAGEEAAAMVLHRYELLAAYTTDVVWEGLAEDQLIWASPSAERIFGRSLEELLAMQPPDLLAEEDRDIARVMAGDVAEGHRLDAVWRFRTAEGSKWFSVRAEPVLDGGQAISGVALLRNVDEAVRAQSALSTLAAASVPLIAATDAGSLVGELCEALIDAGGHVLVWYGRPGAGSSVSLIAQAGYDDGYLDGWVFGDRAGSEHRDWATVTASTAETTLINDIAGDARMDPWRDAAVARGYRSLLCLPVVMPQDGLDGVLSIFGTEAGAFNGPVGTVLEQIADLLGTALERLSR